MFEHMPKRWMAAAIWMAAFLWVPATFAREAPGPDCIDLQNLSGGWRTGEHELLLRAEGNAGARLELDAACPRFPEGVDLMTVAPDDWACPRSRMYVRGGGITCTVMLMDPLSVSQVAEALRQREERLRRTVDLDRVLVQGRHWRDIRGTTDRCVDARFLRGWYQHADGLVVEVSPRRHSGHRFYLVETVETCSDLHGAHSVDLVARSGGAAVCGRPGDKVVLISYRSAGFVSMGSPPSAAFARGCEIRRVTPLPSR